MLLGVAWVLLQDFNVLQACIAIVVGLGFAASFRVPYVKGICHLRVACLWLAANEGMEEKMETTIMGYIGTTASFNSFILNPKP